MSEQIFKKVWYSSDARFKTWRKFFHFDDKGMLEVSDDSLHFSGKKLDIQIAHIKNISLVPLNRPFLVILFAYIIGLAFISLVNWTWDHSFSFSRFVHDSILFALIAILQFFTLRKFKWVCVEYIDEKANNQKAYFSSRVGSWREQLNMKSSEILYQSLQRFNKTTSSS